jgi:hypothetical protein
VRSILVRFNIISICLIISYLSLSVSVAQTIRYVSQGGSNPDPATATAWSSSTPDLLGAINASAPGDQIWVASGTYKPGGNANTNRSLSFLLKNELTIYGGFTGSESSLNQRPALNPITGQPGSSTLSGEINDPATTADNSYHVIRSGGVNQTAVLDGFVVVGGHANGANSEASGGGLLNDGEGPNNQASPTIRNCSFLNNTANRGGAIFNYGDNGLSSPQISNCSFSNNTASEGGVMYNHGFFGNSSPVCVNCLFQNNSASGSGGVVYGGATYGTSSPQFINCAFLANSAQFGGAIYNDGSGGSSDPRFTNCSFQLNSASVYGGAIMNAGYGGTGTLQLVNCVLFGNGGSNTIYTSNARVSASYSLLDATVINYTAANSLMVSNSPFATTTGTALAACSPAVNAGLASAAGLTGITTDLLGNQRVVGPVDMGAQEMQDLSPLPISVAITAVPGQTIIAGSSVRLTASGATTYSWSTGGTTSVITPTPTGVTDYSVTGVSGRCVGTAAITITASCGVQAYVTQNGAGLRDGSSWANAYSGTALQTAINSLSYCGGQVWVAGGTYKPTTTTSRAISFTMANNVAVYGGFIGTETALGQRPAVNPATGTPASSTLSGDIGSTATTDNSYHVIRNPRGLNSTAILDGFIITGGNANGPGNEVHGGGLYNDGSDVGNVCSPTVRNCLFMANVASGSGGGMYNDGRLRGDSSPQLTNCVFRTNMADYGGAMYNTGTFDGKSMPLLINCLFRQNSASSFGGGIYNLGGGTGSPKLINCSFVANAAQIGGAILNDGAPGENGTQLINCSFLGNSAGTGGAIYNLRYEAPTVMARLVNCVFFANGGNKTFNTSPGRITASYSLFDNTVTGYESDPTNLTVTTSPFTGSSDTQLRAGSPAVNTGSDPAYTAAGGPATDLAGSARVAGATIDRGAYELAATLPVTLQYFSGRMTESGALLGWATAREENNAYFRVERSQDAVAFESIATIPTQAPDGNSVETLTYSFLDLSPLPGTTYYRLTQTDRDGPRTTSKIIALTREGAAPVLFPNPVSASGEASIEPAIVYQSYHISDVLGRVVQQVDAPGVLSRVSLAGLQPGVYVLHVQTRDGGAKVWRVLR